jgi:predicted enzyme related to lactoylglutathione lyase
VKLVLSRKGFDSASGGWDSPLLDDHYISMPIPGPGIPYAEIAVTILERVEEPTVLDEVARALWLKQHPDYKPAVPSPHVTFSYPDEPGLSMAGLMSELGIAELKNAWVGDKFHRKIEVEDATGHLDPDLEPRGRPAKWRPMFGQVGDAQSHLENQGVGASDLFLFFGRFCRATRAGGFGGNGTATWMKGASSFHTLWGWLEVEKLIDVNKGDPPAPWAGAHPHFMHAKLWANTKNVVYVAREHLSFEPSLPGGGVFSRSRPIFQLTSENAKNSNDWELPAAFHPKNAGASLSYHSDPKRWSEPFGDRVRLQTVGRGQEFVIDVTQGIQGWIEQLFHEETWNRADRFTETDEFPIRVVSIGEVPMNPMNAPKEKAMLKNYPVYTTLPVTDFARARTFYKDKLGLTPTQPEGDIFEAGKGTGFVLSSMGFKPGGHTQMSFAVDDLVSVVKQLKAKGVVFEEYDVPGLKTVNSIAERPDFKGAWFKDSEGNMIGIGQRL